MEPPILIQGQLRVDDRGEVGFVNDFHFEGVKRMYVVRNHRRGFVRAWHAHEREKKYIAVVSGSAIIGAVAIDNFESPSRDCEPKRFVLSSHTPSVLYIPQGYANGAMTLTDDTIILYFSSSTVEESKNDDHRYDARYWDIWNIEER